MPKRKPRLIIGTNPETGAPTLTIQDTAIQEQHPDVSAYDRGLIMNFATEAAGARYLESKGFKVRDLGGYNYEIKKPGEDDWRVVDPEGFDFQDITDIGGDIADVGLGIVGAGLAAAPAAVPTAGLGAVAAGAAGFGGGVAVSTAARSGIGAALGVPAEAGEVAGEALTQGAIGAAADLTFGVGGLAIKGGLKKLASQRAAKETAKRPMPMPEEWAATKSQVHREAHGEDKVFARQKALEGLDSEISETSRYLETLETMATRDATLVQRLYIGLSPAAKTIVKTDKLPSGATFPSSAVGETFDAAVKLLGEDEVVLIQMIKNMTPSAGKKSAASHRAAQKIRDNPVYKSGKKKGQPKDQYTPAQERANDPRFRELFANVARKEGGVEGREAAVGEAVEKAAFNRRPEVHPGSAEVNAFAKARGGTGRLDWAGNPIATTKHERGILPLEEYTKASSRVGQPARQLGLDKLGRPAEALEAAETEALRQSFKSPNADAFLNVIDKEGRPIYERLKKGILEASPEVQDLNRQLTQLIEQRALIAKTKPTPFKDLTKKELESSWNVEHEIPRIAAAQAQKKARFDAIGKLLSPVARGAEAAARTTGKGMVAAGHALQSPHRISSAALMRSKVGKSIGEEGVQTLMKIMGGAGLLTGSPVAFGAAAGHLAGAAIKGIGKLILRDPESWALKVLRRGGRVDEKTKQLAQLVLNLTRTKGRNAASTALYLALTDNTTRKKIEADSKRLGFKE